MIRLLFALATTGMFLDCAFSEQSPFMYNGVTAHRGNSGEYPENTIPAFESSIFLGADWIELDIHKTKDGQIVVIHDTTTGKVGDRNLQVSQVTYEELKTVDVAHHFRVSKNLTLMECPSANVPLLSEVIRLVLQQNATRLSIQPKADCVKGAIEMVKFLKAEKWVGFNDGNLSKMKQVKALARNIPVFWDRPANSNINEDLRVAHKEGFEAIVINHNGVTKGKVDKIHKGGLEVGAWTVNSTARMKSLLSMGVDRIYTDNPKHLLKLLKK